jgi:LuxR family maltose regulon positive regulatory protein
VAAPPLAEQWVELWLTREPADLARAVGRVPRDRLLAEPRLLFLAGALGVLPAAEAWGTADRFLGPSPVEPGEEVSSAVAALLLQANLHRRHGQFVEGCALAQQAAEVLGAHGGAAPLHERLVVLVQHELGVLSLLAGEVESARTSLLAATGALPAVAPAVRLRLASMLALVSSLAGELLAAEAFLGSVDQARDAGARTTRVGSDAAALARLLLRIDRWDLVQVEGFLRSRAPASFGWLWPVALHAHVQHSLVTGRHEQGLRLVDQAVDTVGRLPATSLCRDVVDASRAGLLVAVGHLGRAWDALREGRTRTPVRQLAEAHVLYAAGELDATRHLVRAVGASSHVTRRDRILLTALEAALALAADDHVVADRSLAHVAVETTTQRWRSYLAHVPPEVLHALPEMTLTSHQKRAVREDPAIPWVPAPLITAPLSPRERLVLRLIVDGAARTEVAEQLGVSVNTVKTHVRHLYAKLGVGNRAELLRLVSRLPACSTHLPPPLPSSLG